MTSFFVSYNGADRGLAEWIAWTLEDVGHKTVIQAWDFRPGGNFILEMQKASKDTDKTIVVLSEDYLGAEYTHPEWAAAFVDDPTSLSRKVIPVKVRDCKPEGLLRPIISIDIVGLDKDAARKSILDGLKTRLKPDVEPPFIVLASANPEIPEVSTLFSEPLPLEVIKPWNVPYDQNVFFTGREEVVYALHDNFAQQNTTARIQFQAISGLGGMGKTQTAVEYAYSYRQEYQAIFWVRSENDQEVRTGFKEIAQLLGLPQQNSQDPDEMIQSVKQWLVQEKSWLLIFDNADHLEPIKHLCLAQMPQGHVLLTSRSQNFHDLGITHPITLDKMLPEKALDFLFIRTVREKVDIAEISAASELAQALDYFPLALEQAGAHIYAQQASFQNYLRSYKRRRLDLLKKTSPVTGNYFKSVETTWDLNFREVESTSKASGDLLRISAFLSPDAIPYKLFSCGSVKMGTVLADALADMDEDPMVFNEFLEPLRRYSLVHIDPTKDLYSIARLVQEVIKAEMAEETQHLWATRTIEALQNAVPPIEYKSWHSWDLLLPHAKVAANLIETYSITSETAALLLGLTGYYLNERAQYNEVEHFYLQSLQVRLQLLGEHHPKIANIYSDLAVLYNTQGRYQDAEKLCLKALELRTQLLGEDHPKVANSLNDLATVFNTQGRYEDAERLYLKSLRLIEDLFGEEHPKVASALNDLATVYNARGCYDEAEATYHRSLDMRKRLLGELHVDVATSLNNLAELYKKQGNYSKAETFCCQSLDMSIQLLGEEHPDVAFSLNNLAELYRLQGRYTDAEPLYLRSLDVCRKFLGEIHPNVAISLNNLALLYSAQGYQDKAEPLYLKSLQIREKLFGKEHPTVATSLNNLAGFYDAQERYEAAEPLYLQSLDMRETTLGKDHPDVALSLNNLACLYQAKGDLNRAKPLFQRAASIWIQKLGGNHPLTMSCLASLKSLRKL